MRNNRAAARLLAGLLVVGTVTVGGLAPAQAYDTGWNGTVAPVDGPPRITHVTHVIKLPTAPSLEDTGWNGT